MSTNEIKKAAERVAKLQAQAEKFSAPLADAQAQLEAAQEAEATRRAERGTVYDHEFADTWRDRADDAAHSGDDARDRFYAALSAEPWFAAYVEYRAARYRRGHVMTEAQRAQRAIGEEVTVPEQRWYATMILDDVQSEVEKRSAELGAQFAEELTQAREDYVSGKNS
ncbi:hypothetical protein F610DRAFT_00766 [Streptomyces sp. LaPpAH-199]|uniref:hypothetical protein n=1 Tax=Streptomyces TaxID=1883 RepID=UPI00088621BB|nr:hypothetical protein [Streptomyces sp. LaPpAH-199]MYW77472.1 hypothetical protein [Streptomyces sp. SID8369]SDB96683.1 hypothetical protein F610DRAFT_00766 [Streptomyces sp. LaPpAH-199]